MAELKEIKNRYAGKCAKCGRELPVGWTVFFNPDTKELFCKPCGSSVTPDDVADIGQILRIEDGAFDGVCSRCDETIEAGNPYYYDTGGKRIICEKCATQLIDAKEHPEKALKLTLDEIISYHVLLSNEVHVMQQKVDNIYQIVKELSTKKETAKIDKDKTHGDTDK